MLSHGASPHKSLCFLIWLNLYMELNSSLFLTYFGNSKWGHQLLERSRYKIHIHTLKLTIIDWILGGEEDDARRLSRRIENFKDFTIFLTIIKIWVMSQIQLCSFTTLWRSTKFLVTKMTINPILWCFNYNFETDIWCLFRLNNYCILMLLINWSLIELIIDPCPICKKK